MSDRIFAGRPSMFLAQQREAYALRARGLKPTVLINCGDCNACCRSGYDIVLGPGKHYSDEVIHDGVRSLRRHDDGSCIYLIDADRPRVCRAYTCALRFFADMPSATSTPVGRVVAEKLYTKSKDAEDERALRRLRVARELVLGAQTRPRLARLLGVDPGQLQSELKTLEGTATVIAQATALRGELLDAMADPAENWPTSRRWRRPPRFVLWLSFGGRQRSVSGGQSTQTARAAVFSNALVTCRTTPLPAEANPPQGREEP